MTSLIIGANGGIGRALVDACLAQGDAVLAVSRQPPEREHPRLQHIAGAASEDEIGAAMEQMGACQGDITRAVITTGLLHRDGEPRVFPEKRLQDIGSEQLLESFHINTVLPLLWVARLLPLLKGGKPCVLAALSARVGSIGDNRLGGWYSYRSSKAGLNMAMKTAAVEYARRAPNVKLLAFHPGTTDTALSTPFQNNVPAEKLFSPAFVADQLQQVSDGLEPDGQLSYLDWQGKPIPW